MEKKIVGIIPARGGSKGVPKKNIKLLNDKPLIEYTIESSIASKVFDKIIVSTDCTQIANICNKYPSIDVVIRPKELSMDNSKTEDALIHVCDKLIKIDNFYPDYVITLEPTSPFRAINTIKSCANVLINSKYDSVAAVVEEKSVLGRVNHNTFHHIFPNEPRRRQDREGLYKESSTIYGTSIEVLRQKKSVLGDNVFALIVTGVETVDINEPLDFEIAELIMKRKI